MAKKLSDIKRAIESREEDFIPYLRERLDSEVVNFLINLSKIDDLYLFSGIIRNYFIGVDEIRDVDVMIDSTKDISNFITKYTHRRNSYGGYKIFINNTTIDLWYLRDTWALRNTQKVLEFELERYIPSTAFFNFSSILFSFKEQTFFYTKHFLRFLRDRRIDYVYEPNANYALCVVNTFYYQDKLKLSLTDNLKRFIFDRYKKYLTEYNTIQIKHFGEILYSNEEIVYRAEHLLNKNSEGQKVIKNTLEGCKH